MNILMAWELGAGLGHTIPLAAIGSCFIADGHTVSYALQNPETAKVANIGPDSEVCAAPVMAAMQKSAAYDCAHMLLVRGYGIPQRLDMQLNRWLQIFKGLSVDIIVADHAPTARLAAHIAGIPTHAVGTGFAIPPLTTPLQPFRDPPNTQVEQQAKLETSLNDIINETLNRYKRPEIERAVDIFFGGSRFLTTFEELDNYNNRTDATYYGPPYGITANDNLVWPSKVKKKVFVYLYPDAPVLPTVLTGLDQLGVSTLVYVNADGRSKLEKFVTKNIQLTDQSLKLPSPEAQCDLVICQGGANTMCASLLQGVPLLTYPRHVEAMMTCSRLQSQGLSAILNAHGNLEVVKQTIVSCFDSELLGEQAKKFAARYQGFDGKRVRRTIADEVLARSRYIVNRALNNPRPKYNFCRL